MIEAQELLMRMRLADYPNMKNEARQEWHREIHRLAYPRSWAESETLSPEQTAERLRAIING
jgi:hypothetical protein